MDSARSGRTAEESRNLKRSRRGGGGGRSFPLRGGALLFGAISVANASNFLFHVVVSRALGPEEYGALGAVLGLLLLFGVPTTALQVAIAHEVASKRNASEGEPVPVVIGPLLANAVLLGLSVTGLLLLLAPVVRSFLHLPSTSTAVMLALFALPCAVGIVPRAVLIGQLRFARVSVALLAGTATRLAMGLWLVRRGSGVPSAVAATVLAEVVTAIVLLPALRGSVRGPSHASPVRVRWRDATGAIVAFTGFWALTGVDTLLARHYLSAAESGLYAAAATGARAVLFLPLAVSLIQLPKFSGAARDSPGARAALVQALVLVGTLSLGALMVVLIAPGLLVSTLFGNAFAGSSAAVGILAVASGFLGVASVLMHYHLASERRAVAALTWAGVLLAIVAVARMHGSIETIAIEMAIVTALVALGMLVVAFLGGSPPVVADERSLWSTDPDRDVSVVVPYFNPGPDLRANIDNIVAVLRASGASFEVIAVSDGSTDGSEETLEGLDPDVVRTIVLTENRGKGEALRTGLAVSRGRYVGFIDADGDVDAAVLGSFVSLVEMYQPDVVLGSKRHPLSNVEYPALRRVYSVGYQQLVRILFRLNIRDSQTGVKLVRREVLAASLSRMVEKRFAFDLELFVVARHLGFSRFLEAPVTIKHQFRSTISIGAVRNMFVDTLAIFYRLRLLRYYDQPRRPVFPGKGQDAGAAHWGSGRW